MLRGFSVTAKFSLSCYRVIDCVYILCVYGMPGVHWRRMGRMVAWHAMNGDPKIACVSAPRLWNSLPACVTSAKTLCTFKKHLKTQLFNQSYNL